jgi:hypothetical protein
VDSRLSALPYSTQVAVAEAAKALVRARTALVTKEKIADRAEARLQRSQITADRLQRNMAAVKYGVRLVHEPMRRAADRLERAERAIGRAERLKSDSRWLITSSHAVLQRPNGPIGGGSDGAAATPPPVLTLGQPVRHPDHIDIGVVVGIIFGDGEHALVRWVDGASFEVIGLLTEVGQPSA